MKKIKLEIVEVAISELKPAEYNPRAMTEKERKDINDSLEEFGMVEPIVVNKAPGRENVIIGGHQRLELLKAAGEITIPVVYLDIPNLEKEKELNLRLNKNLAHWNWEDLAEFDPKLLEDVGFTSLELETSEEDINLEGADAVKFDDFKEIDLLFAKDDPLYEELYGHYKGKNTVDKTNSLLKYLGKK